MYIDLARQLSVFARSVGVRVRAYLAFGEQQLHAATRAAMHDRVVFSFFIVAQVVERGCRRGRGGKFRGWVRHRHLP